MGRKKAHPINRESLYHEYSSTGKALITAKGLDTMKKLGNVATANLIHAVLCGENVRDITEFITRRRLMISNAALLSLLVRNYSSDLFAIAGEGLKESANSEVLLHLWLLGLTKKGLDNIVRGADNINDYTARLDETFKECLTFCGQEFGEISGKIKVGNYERPITWDFLQRLFIAVGAQTLTIRGSEKSAHGKRFGRLVLGSLFSLYGFRHLPEAPATNKEIDKVFWLEYTDENDREIDGTVLANGKGITFDIGFIGRGNPEISLDKVTRYRRQMQFGNVTHEMYTIIIVDTIGENSRIFNMAEGVNGRLIQMRDPYWTKDVAKTIYDFTGFYPKILDISDKNLHLFISSELKKIRLETFF